MISTTYLLTVALHAAVLSVLSSAVLLVAWQARYRAVIAICGLLAVGILPWITALRPAPSPTVVSQEISVAPTPVPTALPVWTIVTLPAEMPTIATHVSERAAAPAGFAFPDPVKSAIALWAAGSAAGLLLLGIAWLRQRHWRNSLEAIDDASWSRLQETGSSLPGRNTFLLTASTASPCVTGFRHPRVVLPRFLFAADSATALVWAVRHELSHVRAGDSRWMLVFSLVRCLHWWNPFIHHLVSRWADVREQLCDLAAADVSEARGEYGKFLVTMAGHIHRRPPLTVAMARRAPARRLKSRIVSLLDAKPGADRPVGKNFVGLSLVGFVAVGVMVSALSIRAEEADVEMDPAVQSPVEEKQPESLSEEAPSNMAESKAPTPAASIKKPKPIQSKMTARFVATIGMSRLRDGAILNATEFNQIMKRLSKVEEAHLLTAPSVTARLGQKATMEIIREVLGTREQFDAIKPGNPVPFVGIQLGFKPTLKGELIELDSSVSYQFIPDVYQPIRDSNTEFKALGFNPDDIKILERKTSARLESGMTVVTDIGEIEPGTFLQMFVTVEPIGATGRRTVGFTDDTVLLDEPDWAKNTIYPSAAYKQNSSRPDGPLPTSEVAGKLKLSGTYIELPHREGSAIPQEPLVQLVPLSSEISQAILSQPDAIVRKLDAVEVPLNEVVTPWPEFPGLMVTATASSDFKWITVSSLPVGEGKNVQGLANMWRDLTNGTTMNFSLISQAPKNERRLLIRVDAVK